MPIITRTVVHGYLVGPEPNRPLSPKELKQPKEREQWVLDAMRGLEVSKKSKK